MKKTELQLFLFILIGARLRDVTKRGTVGPCSMQHQFSLLKAMPKHIYTESTQAMKMGEGVSKP